MIKRRRILLDCDGVLADFVDACLDLIYIHTGAKHTKEEITQYDIFDSLGIPQLKHLLTSAAEKPGWCYSFKPFPGARQAIKRLEEIGEVVIVTSPLVTPRWYYERQKWLTDNLGIGKDRVIFTESKHFIEGDAIIDDSAEKCAKWHKEHPRKLTILKDTPYNKEVVEKQTLRRATSWEQIYEHLERYFVSAR